MDLGRIREGRNQRGAEDLALSPPAMSQDVRGSLPIYLVRAVVAEHEQDVGEVLLVHINTREGGRGEIGGVAIIG